TAGALVEERQRGSRAKHAELELWREGVPDRVGSVPVGDWLGFEGRGRSLRLRRTAMHDRRAEGRPAGCGGDRRREASRAAGPQRRELPGASAGVKDAEVER